MATNSAQHVDVGLKPIAPSSANVSAKSSSSRTTSRQSDPEPVTLRKATGLNPNVLPQVMTVKDRDIGGIYDKVIHRNNWAIDTTNRPYLRYLKSISKGWPHIEWLADFMEVSTTPVKWRVLARAHIDERARKVKVAVLEFSNSGSKPSKQLVNNTEDLQVHLATTQDPEYARLFVVEDLSRDVIEALGAKYDIDPQYFRSQIEDYLWYNTDDAWVELSGLPHIIKTRNYFNLRYMRARYFESENIINEGKDELGHWNVLRRVEEDLSWKLRALKKPEGPTVGLVRSKTALWIRRNKGDEKGIIGIVIVDPTLESGYPLWEGPRNLQPCPSMHATDVDQSGPHGTLFENVCYYACNMSQEEITAIQTDHRVIGLPITNLIVAEWMTVVSYIITGLTKIEYELEHEAYRPNTTLEDLLDRLHPLRRLLPVYRAMICETLSSMLDTDIHCTYNPISIHIRRLNSDFQTILTSVEQLQERTQNIIGLVTTIIGVEENKRAAKTNKNLARVTYIAVVFAPMAFISSFFSMSPDLGDLKHTFWIYLAVALPITLACLFVADYRNLVKRSRKLVPGLKTPEKESPKGKISRTKAGDPEKGAK